jgi:O-antigen/teichoic acid export membrane protein
MYLRHSLTYLLAKLAPLFSSFIILAAYTRWMTKEEYGMYTTILAMVYSANGLLFSWLYTGIMRFWNDQSISTEAVKRLITASVLTISLVVGLGSLLFGIITHQLVVAISFFGVFSSMAFYEAFQRINSITLRVNHYLIAEVLRTLLTTGAGLLFVWLGYATAGAMGAMVLGIVLVLLFSGSFWNYFFVAFRKLDMALFKELLRYGIPLSLSLVFMETINASDRVLISWLSGYADAGQYAVAYNIPAQIIGMISGSLNLAAYPLIIKAMENEGKAVAEEKMKQYFLILTGVSIPALFGLVGIAPVALPLLIGHEFIHTTLELLPWISIAIFANCLYLFHISLSFQLAKNVSASLWMAAFAAVVNVVLNILLIPVYGLTGAVFASIIAYLICLIWGYFMGRKLFALHIPWLDSGKVLLASAVMLILIEQVTTANHLLLALLLKITGGILSYTALIWLLNIGDIRALIRTHPFGLKKLLSVS